MLKLPIPHEAPARCPMKLLNSRCGILSMMACLTMPVMAEANERPGQVTALKELKPYLQLASDGSDLSLDNSVDAAELDSAVEKMRALLLKEGTFQPWSEKRARSAFKSEHTVSWRGEQRTVEVSLSLASNEALVEVPEDGKKLRYEIGEDTKWEIVQLFANRKNAIRAQHEAMMAELRAKSTPVEKSDAWRKSIADGAVLTVHEGLPRSGDELYQRESLRSDVQVTGGYAFYTPGVVAKHRADLAKLLADASSYHGFSGTKECGGFHPDFAISWSVNRQTVTLLICYGCHEAIFTDGKASLKYDLNHEAGKKMEPLLKESGGKRPVQ
jgi:hypothetical protein